ncbi:MAG: hypothetical protein ACRD38_05525 [Nitrososphaerales archaeon]
MMSRNGYNGYNELARLSLEKALDILGESSKNTLIYYLTRQYGITTFSNVTEIQLALKSILGTGAYVIIEGMESEMQRLAEQR